MAAGDDRPDDFYAILPDTSQRVGSHPDDPDARIAQIMDRRTHRPHEAEHAVALET